jgi:Leucine-rich repeat (LRR) protein
MPKGDVTDRIEFLAKKFDVFESEDKKQIKAKFEELKKYGYESKVIGLDSAESSVAPLALLSTKPNKERSLKHISVSLNVFSAMIAADPTPNKSCVQWMLNVFTRYIREDNLATAIRFVTEDLPQASDYLVLFEANKRKKKFIELAKTSYILKHVKDPTDINQYKSLSHLFDAVDPFIIREPSTIESLLLKYVGYGQALIPVADRRFTLYIPKTSDASTVFGDFSSWCTARVGNSNFSTYTNQLKPNGKKSDIYIIIDNKFFTGESKEIYQIHFESEQIRDRSNYEVNNIFEDIINESEGLANFFYEELMAMAKDCKGGLDNNLYLDYLIRFGFCESLFELMDENTPTIMIRKREIPRLSDLSRFKMLDQLVIADAKLVEIHPSIGKLTNLEMLALPNNHLKTLPKELGSLKKLGFLNILGNKIISIPNELKYLDRTNGGSLWRMVTCKEDIGEENYQKLKELLPTVEIN